MTDRFSFEGKRVTVFGLGISGGGVGTVEFLVRHGAKEIIVTDAKNESELATSVSKIRDFPGVTLVLGVHRRADFLEVDMVIKNPRIPWTDEYVRLAQDHGVPVEMDSSIFFALCPAPIIGITGTKGKTTTATCIAHLFRSAGKDVLEVGIGETPVLSLLDEVKSDAVVVFELSSWRLSALSSVKKSPHISVFTSFAPDHLNYYASMEEYFSDKANIFRFQKQEDVFVYDNDNRRLREAAASVFSNLFFFSRHEHEGNGVFVRGGDIVLRQHREESIVASVHEIPLPGEHNRMNMLAALAAVYVYGIPLQDIRRGISTFSGVPHRLEFVGEKRGLRWYNDTAATIPDAAIAGIRAFNDPLILLAGGNDKNLDFDEFGKVLSEAENVSGVILFSGDASEKISRALERYSGERKILGMVHSMPEALDLALSSPVEKHVVLLSPGAASFGLFRNEFDRGNQFREMVVKL